MELKKKKEIDLADAIIRMIQQPGSVTVYQPIENPEEKYTINDLKGMSVNDGAVFMIEDDEPEAAPEPAPEEDQPEQETPKRRGPVIDDGKIMALHKANWPITEIAADLGISHQTVRNHLKRMGYLKNSNDSSEEADDAGENS